MAEVQKIRCKDCARICRAIPISTEMIEYTYSRGYKKEQEQLEKTFLLKRILVQCVLDGRFYFVKM